jgi:hypothetical protein
MMPANGNPALQAFVSRIRDEIVLAQVLIRSAEGRYELRHAANRLSEASKLRLLPPAEVRTICQFTSKGCFRPLKSAPNLQAGWRLLAANDRELETFLGQIYPGAVADWYAAQSTRPPLTHYRDFAKRQSGMYRITNRMSDTQAASVIRACCHPQFCLKQRLWTVDGLAPDRSTEKSLIPCLEPCALWLEFARKAARHEQQDKAALELAPEELATLRTALQALLAKPEAGQQEGDFSSPANPRRIQLLLEKLPPLMSSAPMIERE